MASGRKKQWIRIRNKIKRTQGLVKLELYLSSKNNRDVKKS